MKDMKDWKIYKGTQIPRKDIDIKNLPGPPPWRDFSKPKSYTHGQTFCLNSEGDGKEIELINAAIYLRRPLLITGPPGSGKSSLAHAVAFELDLGKILRWPINSHSTLAEGLYSYDAVARLRDITYEQRRQEIEKNCLDHRLGHPAPAGLPDPAGSLDSAMQAGRNDDQGPKNRRDDFTDDIGPYIKLGQLGTALFPKENKPRVLLIDEIDKSDIDLPNDLLHIFEEGEFLIPELVRVAEKQERVRVMPYDGEKEDDKIEITRGKVKCQYFPFVFMTSNGERDFPPAFLRRCLHLDIDPPDENQLRRIIDAHLDHYDSEETENILKVFNEKRRKSGVVATDQLLNAVFLLASGRNINDNEQKKLEQAILKELDRI